MRKTLLVLLLFSAAVGTAQNAFKVVGYLPTYRFDNLSQIELQYCTHVNIAFINPNMAGNLSADGYSLTPVVSAIHNAGAEAFISLAGGYLPPAINDAWDFWLLPANRPTFIQNIVQYALNNNIDGVDIDLEWQYVDQYYSPFITELKPALAAHGIPLTAALPGSYRYPQVSNAALAAFDWVNMMVYDLRGPWDPSNPGQHSPYWWAEDCIAYWLNQGVPANKLTLGMPFYGYNFANSPVSSFTYRYMVGLSTDYAVVDNVDQRWYNGIPTIQAKTSLAIENGLLGVMMWELGQDVLAANLKQYSLLRAIDGVVNPASGTSTPLVANLNIYPNPTSDWVRVEGAEALVLYDLNGREVGRSQGTEMQLTELPAGMYMVHAWQGEQFMVGRVIKM
ncbi:MAG: T9SS type A sorting domain-containing protein [Lewinellaceae bacterium]|nr:T9SS type A sorting domain-containing protein [Lewinellaceae bacterium]